MAKPKIDAKQALEDIRSGTDDQTLMAKYGLSAKGLQSLFKKLILLGVVTRQEIDQRTPESLGDVGITGDRQSALGGGKSPGRTVNAQEAARDVRSGVPDADLMEKYRLSAKGLQSLFRQLVDAEVVSQREIDARMPWTESTVDVLGILRQHGLDRSYIAKRDTDVPSNCVACGVPQTMEFDVCPTCGTNVSEFKAKRMERKQREKAAWICPACGRPQGKEYAECPVCGVIVSKLR
ncbi:MAG: zinc ribbon domain-containing protein [Desulfomonilaceae bacterium]|nr:zinc ribbon domain-containing protein [Desulfomonilaceae bacterium]